MIAPSHDNQFAPAVPSPQLSIGRPATSSRPGRAATSIIDDQTYDGRAGGASLRFGARGCDRHAPAHRQGRVHSFAAGSVMAFSSTMTLFLPETGGGFGPRIFPALSHIDGIGRRANAIQANLIQSRRQGRFQRFAKGQPRHFKTSASVAFQPSDGARGSVPVRTGKLPPERGERPHVGHG